MGNYVGHFQTDELEIIQSFERVRVMRTLEQSIGYRVFLAKIYVACKNFGEYAIYADSDLDIRSLARTHEQVSSIY